MISEKILVGHITTCHGVKGELKVKLLTDFPERFKPGGELYMGREDGGDAKKVTVRTVRSHKGHLLVTLSGVENRNDAQLLRGLFFLIDKEDVKPLPQGRYYIFELEGLKVYDLQENYLGVLKQVVTAPAHDLYVVDCEGRDLLVPAVRQFVRGIDTEKGVMHVDKEALEF